MTDASEETLEFLLAVDRAGGVFDDDQTAAPLPHRVRKLFRVGGKPRLTAPGCREFGKHERRLALRPPRLAADCTRQRGLAAFRRAENANALH